jgi:hypothetical protein
MEGCFNVRKELVCFALVLEKNSCGIIKVAESISIPVIRLALETIGDSKF